MKQVIGIALATAAISQFGTDTAVHAAEYFAGKTITVFAGFPAGSPVDTFGRMTSTAMGRHVPGNPNVIMKFMPGAGGVKALNFLASKAKPDGLTVLYGPWVPMGEITDDPAMRFKFGDLTPIGGVGHLGRVAYIRKDVAPGGYKGPSQLGNLRELRLAGERPANSSDARALLSLELLGIKFRYVPGFRGIRNATLGLYRKEGDLAAATIQFYRNGVVKMNKQNDDALAPLWSWPLPDGKGNFRANPNAPKFPSFVDVYKTVKGKAPSGPLWEDLKTVLELHGSTAQVLLAPPGVPKDIADILRKAWVEGLNDDIYKAAYRKATGMVAPAVPTATLLRDVALVAKVPAETRQRLKKMIDKYTK